MSCSQFFCCYRIQSKQSSEQQSAADVTSYDVSMMNMTLTGGNEVNDVTSQAMSLADELAACASGVPDQSQLNMTLADDLTDLTVGLTGEASHLS